MNLKSLFVCPNYKKRFVINKRAKPQIALFFISIRHLMLMIAFQQGYNKFLF